MRKQIIQRVNPESWRLNWIENIIWDVVLVVPAKVLEEYSHPNPKELDDAKPRKRDCKG